MPSVFNNNNDRKQDIDVIIGCEGIYHYLWEY